MDAEARRQHWKSVHRDKAPGETSWFQDTPEPSLRLIAASGLGRDAAVIDVGGGASTLVDHLLDGGWSTVTVLDMAEEALERARTRFGARAAAVRWLAADVTAWRPDQAYALWHDRAAFHFLTEPEQRAAYRATLEAAVPAGGQVILATFAADGPERCSGLPVARYDAAALAAEFAGAACGWWTAYGTSTPPRPASCRPSPSAASSASDHPSDAGALSVR